MDGPTRWIGDMYGPHFLLFYGAVIAVTIGGCYWRLRARIASLSSQEAGEVEDFHHLVSRACLRIRILATAVILAVGGYKLVIAFQKGKSNVLFLILMGLASTVVIWCIARVPGERDSG